VPDRPIEGFPGFCQPIEVQISPSQSVVYLRPVPMMVQGFQPVLQCFLILFLLEQRTGQFGAGIGDDVDFQAGLVASVFFSDRMGIGIPLDASSEVGLCFLPLLHLVKAVSQTFHGFRGSRLRR